jgi:phosphoglycerol transferase MdoB-like AlkP superfamily enzyme
MVERKINHYALLMTLNGVIAFIMLVIYKYVRGSYSIIPFIVWVETYTKRFAIYFLILFILLMLTAKLQIKTITWLKEVTPWLLIVSKYLYVFLLSTVMAFVTSYYMVYFQLLKNSPATLQWVEQNNEIYLAGTLFLFFLYLMVFALIGNIYISSIVTAIIIYAIGFTHYNKLNLRVEPLYPSDFSQVTQIKDVIPMIKEYLSISSLLLIVIGTAVIIYLVKFLPKAKSPLWMRGILLVFTSYMVYSFVFFPTTFLKDYVKNSKVSVVQWNQIENYQLNGFIFAFISNLQNDAYPEPDGYSKKKVLATAEKYKNVETTQAATNDLPKQPNIIYVMSEAFWDPLLLPNVEYSEDPMKNVRQLMDEYSSGGLLSPAFGGATANVEFEALTGFSNYFLRVGSVPFQDLVDRKKFIPTIVSDLEEQGYNSLAIHPYNKVFYKRTKVYETFGFDQFIDMSTMKHKEMSGPYISDESLSKDLIDTIKEQKEPLFIHAVSVANHFPYVPNRYEKTTIGVNGLTKESNEALEVFAHGINKADEAFKLLVDELEQLDEPTIVVFWGDHLPILGQDLAIYKEATFANTEDKNEYERVYAETPLLIYANYPIEKQALQTVSPNYLAPIVYGLAGLEKPPFYRMLDMVREELPGLKITVQIDGNQEYVTGNLSKKQQELLNDYKLLEYDLLVGKQYSKDVLFEK